MTMGLNCSCFPSEDLDEPTSYKRSLLANHKNQAGGAPLPTTLRPKKEQGNSDSNASELQKAQDEINRLNEELSRLKDEVESQGRLMRTLRQELSLEKNAACRARADSKSKQAELIKAERNLRDTTSKAEDLMLHVNSILAQKQAAQKDLDLFEKKFEEIYALLADNGFEIEFLDEEVMRKIFPAKPEMDDTAEEFMDEMCHDLRQELRKELVPRNQLLNLHNADSLFMCGKTVELMLNRIDTLGMSHQHFNADLLETEDLIALMDIRDQFDELPVLEGYLEKLSPSKYAGWQQRWVVVRDWVLFWAKKEVDVGKKHASLTPKQKKKFVNHIPLMLVKAVTVGPKEGQFTIVAQDRKNGQVRNYTWRVLSSQGSKARKAWTDGLERYRSNLQLCMQWLSMTKTMKAVSPNARKSRYVAGESVLPEN